ncbi:MAG: response regulator [Deltaproteobacteria bacterium]|nr:response regulator [Deltaproteobacteria bacterium]
MSDKKRILAIDDDPDILQAVKAILNSAGFEVSTAKSAKDGLEYIDSVKPDLVLCDMMMESVDAGIAFANDFRNKYPDIPVYLMSSIGDATAENIEIEKIGFKGVFQKPIDPEVLLSTVKAFLKE